MSSERAKTAGDHIKELYEMITTGFQETAKIVEMLDKRLKRLEGHEDLRQHIERGEEEARRSVAIGVPFPRDPDDVAGA